MVIAKLVAVLLMFTFFTGAKVIETPALNPGEFPRRFFQGLSWAHLVVTIALCTGAIFAAVGAARGQTRWWVLVALGIAGDKAGTLAPWLLSLVEIEVSPFSPLPEMGSLVCLVVAALAFAKAASGGATHRLAIWSFIGWVALHVVTVIVYAVIRTEPWRPIEWLNTVQRVITFETLALWSFITIDMLGAFSRPSNGLPIASIRGLPATSVRTAAWKVAAAVSFALCLFGVAGAAFGLWITNQRSTTEPAYDVFLFGGFVFVTGTLGLACTRRADPGRDHEAGTTE